MIPKSLVQHNVAWAPGEKLLITALTAPASSASARIAAVAVLRGLSTAPAPGTGRRRVIDRFSPGWCGSSGGPVVAVATVLPLDGAARRWEKGRPGPRRRGRDPPSEPRAPLMQERDSASKWLICFHADALVRLAGIRRIASWQAVQ